MRSVILFLCVAFVCADVLDKVVKQASDTVDKAQGGKIRQCTCDEQHECVTELEAHGKECMDSCFGKFKKLTKHTEELHDCFQEAEMAIGTMITCMEDEATSCAKEKTDKQVDKVDIKQLISTGTQKLLTLEKNLTALFAGEVKEVFDTLTEFGTCVKDCTLEKNSGGFCFDKKECQPLLDEKAEAKKAVKKCAKQVNFKAHAGEICECAKTKAKVANLNKFCPIIKQAAEGAKDIVKGANNS